MKKIIAFFALLFLTTNVQAMTATEHVQQVANEILQKVITPTETLQTRQKEFKNIFYKYANTRKMVKYTLGTYAKQVDETTLKRFEEAALQSLVVTWTDRFTKYAGEKFKYKKEVAEKDVFVYTTMDIPNTDNDIEIIWRVNTNKQGEMKIVDIIAEGVSMIQSYREDYTNFLRQNNGDFEALIKKLNSNAQK